MLTEPVAAASRVESDTNAFHEASLEAPLESPADAESPQMADDADDVPVDAPVMPLFMSPEVAAREMVDASPGDDLDTFANDLPGTSDEIPTFEQPEAEAETDFSETDTPAPEAASPKSKRGMFSLFGLFRGKSKKPKDAKPARESASRDEAASMPLEAVEDTLPIGSEAEFNTEDLSAPDDTATIMEPVVAEAVPLAAHVPVPEPEAPPEPEPTASEDDVMGFLASEQPAEPEEQVDAGLGDFLKHLDR